MKKILSLIITLVLVLGLCACGGDTAEEAGGTTNQTGNETTEQSNNSDTVDQIVTDEEFVGVYVSSYDENKIFVFTEDESNPVLQGSRRVDGTTVAMYDMYEIYKWEIAGNTLTLYEATGFETVVFEIVKDGDNIQLKFVEKTGDGPLDAYPVLLADLTKVTVVE